ncbi:putative methyl-CpG binding domain protein 4-like protein [Operophtera brumata]|uniref:Putative methyl-CpG binding domain protein 4-like protein n=1 Tax=Operophtera brumata TaxID=104452 RepID=A0A0L7KY38_OPEBR|nr:putative methyl-CpG binding domain protein 4-like protein [Operophtera brumata]
MDSDCFSQFFHDDEDISYNSPQDTPASHNSDSSQHLSQSSPDEDALSLSQLTCEDQEPLNIPCYYNITPRDIPTSPHNVFEEEFSSNPWAMFIATIFLTKTSGKTARRFIKDFFLTYPTPYEVLEDSPKSLERFFDNLGLKKRGHMIWKLTYQFVSSKWRRASDLCGIGKYGEDAYRIFCLGHTDLDPGDRYLKLYLDWLVCHTDFLKDNGVIDSTQL